MACTPVRSPSRNRHQERGLDTHSRGRFERECEPDPYLPSSGLNDNQRVRGEEAAFRSGVLSANQRMSVVLRICRGTRVMYHLEVQGSGKPCNQAAQSECRPAGKRLFNTAQAGQVHRDFAVRLSVELESRRGDYSRIHPSRREASMQ